MKILAVSDVFLDYIYSFNIRTNFGGVDLVLGCGDLPYEYLEFIVSGLNVPLLYVPGNHDPAYDEKNPVARADGCDNVDRRVQRVKGLTVAGLGGSVRYHPHQPNQYSQGDMYLRLLGFAPALLWSRLRTRAPLDILIAHSPPRGIHDDDDPAHVGFAAFGELIRAFKPRFFLHGHTMVYKSNLTSPVTRVGATTVINIYPYRVFEVDVHVR